MKSKFSIVEDNDDAMLSKRPLGGFSCASCEKGLKNISGYASDFQNWNKMPSTAREPIAKVG